MSRIRHVLAATDLSSPARHAVERAASLARDVGATLGLVHVAPVPPLEALRRWVTGLPDDLPERWRAETDAALHAQAESLQRRHGVEVRVDLVVGELLGAIASVADATAASLLVLGARGGSSLRQVVLGSTAERLVGTCVRPMLVVKQVVHEPYRSLLVPVDFTTVAAPALRCAAAVAPGARIRILHAFEAPFEGKLRTAGVSERALRDYRQGAEREAREQMAALRTQCALAQSDVETLVLHGGAVARILEQEQDNDSDLIVLGKRAGSRIEDVLLGGVTRRVLAESQCDVLVVPSTATNG